MKFEVYKKPDGTEELRLKPESENDCDEIECSQCFFENNETGNCIDESDIEDHINELALRFFDPSIEFGITPKMMHRSRKPTFEEILEKFGFPGFMIEENANRSPGRMTITDVRTFAIKDGKVMADPETLRLMNQLGIIEKIERSIREEEDEN